MQRPPQLGNLPGFIADQSVASNHKGAPMAASTKQGRDPRASGVVVHSFWTWAPSLSWSDQVHAKPAMEYKLDYCHRLSSIMPSTSTAITSRLRRAAASYSAIISADESPAPERSDCSVLMPRSAREQEGAARAQGRAGAPMKASMDGTVLHLRQHGVFFCSGWTSGFRLTGSIWPVWRYRQPGQFGK